MLVTMALEPMVNSPAAVLPMINPPLNVASALPRMAIELSVVTSVAVVGRPPVLTVKSAAGTGTPNGSQFAAVNQSPVVVSQVSEAAKADWLTQPAPIMAVTVRPRTNR